MIQSSGPSFPSIDQVTEVGQSMTRSHAASPDDSYFWCGSIGNVAEPPQFNGFIGQCVCRNANSGAFLMTNPSGADQTISSKTISQVLSFCFSFVCFLLSITPCLVVVGD